MPWTLEAVKKKMEIIETSMSRLNFIIYELREDYAKKEEHEMRCLKVIKQCYERKTLL